MMYATLSESSQNFLQAKPLSRLQSLSKSLPVLVLSPAHQNSPAIKHSGFYLRDGLWQLSLGIQPLSSMLP